MSAKGQPKGKRWFAKSIYADEFEAGVDVGKTFVRFLNDAKLLPGEVFVLTVGHGHIENIEFIYFAEKKMKVRYVKSDG